MRFAQVSLLSLLFAAGAGAQNRINPASQINWPFTTGSGAPTASCNSSNYGQPYRDIAGNVSYSCGVSGWVLSAAKGDTGATGATGAPGPPASPTGPWSSSPTYTFGQIVSFGSNSFAALVTNTNVQPPSSCTSNSTWAVSACSPTLSYQSVLCTGATTDAALLQTAMNVGQTKIIVKSTGSSCLVPQGTVLVEQDGNDIEWNGIPLQKTTVGTITENYMIDNQALVSPTFLFSPVDVTTTAGSPIISSASSNFSTLNLQANSYSVHCVGVMTGNAGAGTDLYTTVVQLQTATTQIALRDSPEVSVAGTAHCFMYKRDVIRNRGMNLIAAGTGPSDQTYHLAHFGSVYHSVFENVATSENASFGSQFIVSDSVDTTIRNIVSGSSSVLSDLVDIMAPTIGFTVEGLSGVCGDDCVATAANFCGGAAPFRDCTYGAMHGLNIQNIHPSTGENAVKIRSALTAPIFDVTIRDVMCQNYGITATNTVGTPQGCVNGVFVGDETGNDPTSLQGKVDNIVIDNVGGYIMGAPVTIAGQNIGVVTVSKGTSTYGTWKASVQRFVVNVTDQGTPGATPTHINTLILDGLRPNMKQGMGVFGITTNSLGGINHLLIKNSEVWNYNILSNYLGMMYFKGGTYDNITIDGCMFDFNTTSAYTSGIIHFTQVSSFIISTTELNVKNCSASAQAGSLSPGDLVHFDTATAYPANAYYSNLSYRSATSGLAASILGSVQSYTPPFRINTLYANNITGCIGFAGASLIYTSSGITTGGTIASPSTCLNTVLQICNSAMTWAASLTVPLSCPVARVSLQLGNITTLTVPAGQDGQDICLVFLQSSSAAKTVAAPANWKGFFTVGTTLSKLNIQCAKYSVPDTSWLSTGVGQTNQ
jgi:hypothetical protein